MIAALLLRELVTFLQQSVDEYSAAQGLTGEYRKPIVYPWRLPFKNPNRPDADQLDFPFITAGISEGEDTDNDSRVRVDLAFGVHRKSEMVDGFYHPDGYDDLLALMEHTRIAFFRQRVIDRRFVVLKPYKWHIPDEQPYPLWVGVAQSIWQVAAVMPQEDEVDLHGSSWI